MGTGAQSSGLMSVTARRLMKELHPRRLLPSLSAGLVVAMIDIPLEISIAALIFSGDLSSHVSAGIGLHLFGGLVISLVVALTSSFPGMVALPQEAPAAILALAATAIAAGMPASATSLDTFLTVVAALAVTSVLTGAFFLALGRCKLGAWIRYVPYPVVGGFLASTGWLLVHGAFGVMTDQSLGWSQLPSLLQPIMLARWLPGLILAALLLLILRRRSHSMIVPTLVLAATGLFYILLWATSTSIAEATAQGWLLGPFPQGALWRPLTPPDLAQVHWQVILRQAGSVGTLLFISAIGLLLNTSGLELAARRDIDFDRELQSAGLANLAASLGGSPPGFQTLTYSVAGRRMAADSRLVGVFTGVLYGAVLLFGAPLLSYAPKPVLGGLLLFLGLGFLVEWLHDAWFKLSRAEYGLVLLILITMNVAGLVASLALGIVLAVALFAVSYSRISAVRHTLSGANYRSNVDRPRQDLQTLRRRGHWLYILELQGFIFFGTANRLLEQVRQRANDPDLPAPRYVVLDFRQVSGLDASAVLSFTKMKQLAEAKDMRLVFTHLPARVRRQLANEVLTDSDRSLWHTEVDLDHGVEWCEEQILCVRDGEDTATAGRARVAPFQPESITGIDLRDYMERMDLAEGHYLIRQGDAPRGLFFVERGQVTALREGEDGLVIRLRKMGPGTVVGEMGLYLDSEASASIVTNEPSTVYHLSKANLSRIEETEPATAAALHRYIAEILSERVSTANDTIQALLAEPEATSPPRA